MPALTLPRRSTSTASWASSGLLRAREPDGDEHQVGLLDELAARHRLEVARRGAGDRAAVHAHDAAILALERGDLLGPAPLAALVERVGAQRALGRLRPRCPVVAAARRQLGIDVEDHRVAGALAQRVGDAVHAGVAAADHDHALAAGRDRLLGGPVRPPLLLGDPAVALVEVVHREVDAVEVAALDVEVAVDPRAGRDHDRVVLARSCSAVMSMPTSTLQLEVTPSASSRRRAGR